MKISLSTGGDQDFLELEAESQEDAVVLYQISNSGFLREKERFNFFTAGWKFHLRVLVSDLKKASPSEQAAVNAAHDQEN